MENRAGRAEGLARGPATAGRGRLKEIVVMGLLPDFFGVGQFAPNAQPRRAPARTAVMLGCALVLGVAGGAGPISGAAFAEGT